MLKRFWMGRLFLMWFFLKTMEWIGYLFGVCAFNTFEGLFIELIGGTTGFAHSVF
jgi:hypothetical protein